jgi:thymidylate synthase (FAD)
MRVILVNHTPDPEKTVACAARACFADQEYETINTDLKPEDVNRLIATVITKNHLSVLEHVCFTFAISGVSRVLTHQLVRHRIASYSQLSQQRADSSKIDFTVPPEIADQPQFADEYRELVARCQDLYGRLVRSGISRGSARYILPSSSNTKIVVTMNARSLFNLFAQRECGVEEWEFRKLALLLHTRLMSVAPNIFKFAGPPCKTQGLCPEKRDVHQCCGYFGESEGSSEHRKIVSTQIAGVK